MRKSNTIGEQIVVIHVYAFGQFRVWYKQTYVNLVNIATAITLVFATVTSTNAAPNNHDAIHPKTAALLDFIGSIEAPRGYDDYYRLVSSPPPRPLTQMTIREVQAWQYRIDRYSKSEAAGRFQIVKETLGSLVRNNAIGPNQLFDVAMQNRLALILLEGRGWNPNSTAYIKMANSLAKEWAALPLVSGPNKGLSAYHYDKRAKNRAQVTPAAFLDVLKNGRNASPALRAVKLSKSKRRVASVSSGAVKLNRISSTRTVKKSKVAGGAITPSKVIVFTSDPYRMD